MSISVTQRCFIDVLGLRTAYYRSGSGPSVVLMHGSSPGACTELNWFRNFDDLVWAGFDVIAFDQAGFGYTDSPADHGIEFRYQHSVALLQALGIREAVLVGNSMGGLLAVLMSDRQSELPIKVRGLILAAQYPHFEMTDEIKKKLQQHMSRLASLEPTLDSVRALTSNTLANHDNLTESLLQLRLAMLVRTYEAHKLRGSTGNNFQFEHVRSKPVSTRSLIIWGIQDHSLPIEIGLEAMQHFSNAEFIFLPRCGHWPQTEHARHFNNLVVEFCQLDFN